MLEIPFQDEVSISQFKEPASRVRVCLFFRVSCLTSDSVRKPLSSLIGSLRMDICESYRVVLLFFIIMPVNTQSEAPEADTTEAESEPCS